MTPGSKLALDVDREHLRSGLGKGLGGEDVLDLGGADAERDGAEGSVGGGVGVAAHNGHPGQRPALLGSHHVHDALAGVAHREVHDAELGGVGPERLDLFAADRIGDRLVDVGGGDVVVLGRDGEVGASNRATGEAQAVEGLRRGHLVDQVEVDVEQVGFSRRRIDDVAVPDLLCQGSGAVSHFASLGGDRVGLPVELSHIVRYGSQPMEPTVSGVGVLDKSVRVLNCVGEEKRTLAELVDSTGLTRATAHRLATALEQHGLMRRTRATVASRSGCTCWRSAVQQRSSSHSPSVRCPRWRCCATRRESRCSCT